MHLLLFVSGLIFFAKVILNLSGNQLDGTIPDLAKLTKLSKYVCFCMLVADC